MSTALRAPQSFLDIFGQALADLDANQLFKVRSYVAADGEGTEISHCDAIPDRQRVVHGYAYPHTVKRFACFNFCPVAIGKVVGFDVGHPTIDIP